ncbi:MAG: cysteine dioxygenase, partial [Bacteroidota bacterium]
MLIMKNLLNVLENIDTSNIKPKVVREVLQSVDLKNLSYKSYLEGYDLGQYNRIRLSDKHLQVFLMTWPPQFLLPIHQHKNFWGFVIPLEGIVSETIYGYAPRKKKVYLHPTKTYKPGEIIYEPYNVIHKLQNTSPLDTTVSLHIYYPPSMGYKGTMIFDAQNRRMAVLNEKAKALSWDLPEDHYDSILEDAYDVEKLW